MPLSSTSIVLKHISNAWLFSQFAVFICVSYNFLAFKYSFLSIINSDEYLKYGFEVYYNILPKHYEKIVFDKNTKHLYNEYFSRIVFVDNELYTPENMNDINNFAYKRNLVSINWNNNFNEQYLYYMSVLILIK